jgi:hypothetical protein
MEFLFSPSEVPLQEQSKLISRIFIKGTQKKKKHPESSHTYLFNNWKVHTDASTGDALFQNHLEYHNVSFPSPIKCQKHDLPVKIKANMGWLWTLNSPT